MVIKSSEWKERIEILQGGKLAGMQHFNQEANSNITVKSHADVMGPLMAPVEDASPLQCPSKSSLPQTNHEKI